MNDDRGDNIPAVTRRQILAGVSAAALGGVAGCSTTSSDTPTTGVGTQNGSQSTASQTNTTVSGEPLYSGKTIPPTSHDEMASQPPTIAAPAAEVTNPVVTADDVTDFGNVDYVADPFLFVEDGTWHLFFEAVNTDRSPDAVISHAASDDGLNYDYQGIALEKESHTSFPYIWKFEGDYYMTPADGKAVGLWKATSFPGEWEKQGTVLEKDHFIHDPVFFKRDDRWWLFTSRENSDVLAYHAEELTADPSAWTAHANNPVVTDRRRAARQGGRPVVMDNSVYLFFQDLEYEYGDQIRAFRVTDLSPESYSDEEVEHSPVLTGFGSGWNSRKMHHYDPWALGDGSGWRAAVDGAHGPSGNEATWGIGIFDVPNIRQPDPAAIPYDESKTSGYYRLDGESPVAVDDSGNANHGMVRGTEQASVGGCPGRQFVNERDRVVFPTTFDTLGSEAFTLLFRGTLAAPEEPQTLFSYTSRHVDRRLAIRYDPDKSGWKVDLNGTDDRVQPAVSADLSPETPFQFALTYKQGDGYRLFQDGTELTTARDVGDAFHEVCVPVVGATLPGQFPWKGTVSHVGVFDEALDKETLQSFTGSVCQSE